MFTGNRFIRNCTGCETLRYSLHPTCKPPQAPQIYVVASVRYSPSMRAGVTA